MTKQLTRLIAVFLIACLIQDSAQAAPSPEFRVLAVTQCSVLDTHCLLGTQALAQPSWTAKPLYALHTVAGFWSAVPDAAAIGISGIVTLLSLLGIMEAALSRIGRLPETKRNKWMAFLFVIFFPVAGIFAWWMYYALASSSAAQSASAHYFMAIAGFVAAAAVMVQAFKQPLAHGAIWINRLADSDAVNALMRKMRGMNAIARSEAIEDLTLNNIEITASIGFLLQIAAFDQDARVRRKALQLLGPRVDAYGAAWMIQASRIPDSETRFNYYAAWSEELKMMRSGLEQAMYGEKNKSVILAAEQLKEKWTEESKISEKPLENQGTAGGGMAEGDIVGTVIQPAGLDKNPNGMVTLFVKPWDRAIIRQEKYEIPFQLPYEMEEESRMMVIHLMRAHLENEQDRRAPISSRMEEIIEQALEWYAKEFKGITAVLGYHRVVKGLGTPNFIGVSSRLKSNPAAWLHEIFEAYFADQKKSVASGFVEKETFSEAGADWFERHITKPHRKYSVRHLWARVITKEALPMADDQLTHLIRTDRYYPKILVDPPPLVYETFHDLLTPREKKLIWVIDELRELNFGAIAKLSSFRSIAAMKIEFKDGMVHRFLSDIQESLQKFIRNIALFGLDLDYYFAGKRSVLSGLAEKLPQLRQIAEKSSEPASQPTNSKIPLTKESRDFSAQGVMWITAGDKTYYPDPENKTLSGLHFLIRIESASPDRYQATIQDYSGSGTIVDYFPAPEQGEAHGAAQSAALVTGVLAMLLDPAAAVSHFLFIGGALLTAYHHWPLMRSRRGLLSRSA